MEDKAIQKDTDKKDIPASYVIAHLQQLAGESNEDIASILKIKPKSVSEYASRGRAIINSKNADLALFNQAQLRLAPLAVNAVALHLKAGTKEIVKAYMEGNGLWRKNVQVTNTIMDIDMRDLAAIIQAKRPGTPEERTIRRAVDAEYTIVPDTDNDNVSRETNVQCGHNDTDIPINNNDYRTKPEGSGGNGDRAGDIQREDISLSHSPQNILNPISNMDNTIDDKPKRKYSKRGRPAGRTKARGRPREEK